MDLKSSTWRLNDQLKADTEFHWRKSDSQRQRDVDKQKIEVLHFPLNCIAKSYKKRDKIKA